MKIFILVFIAVCTLSAALAWLYGFDFNARSPGVAFYAGFTVFAAALIGSAVSSDFDSPKS